MSSRAYPLAFCALALARCADPAPSSPDAAADAPMESSVDAAPALRATAPFVRYADPMVGTGGVGFGTGSAFPGAQRPFGLARPGPDTSDVNGDGLGFQHCAGYAYSDQFITGFSQLHMHGTGIVDYGVLGFMPTIGMSPAKTRQAGRLLAFDHTRERAEPGYYRVALGGEDLVVEASATDHTALYRVTFPRGSDGHLLIDLGHTIPGVRVLNAQVEVDPEGGELRGSLRFQGGYSDRIGGVEVFWVARLSRPLTRAATWTDSAVSPSARSATGPRVGVYVPVDTAPNNAVTVAFGLSLTDLAHARTNLSAEAADLDFDRVRREATAAWEPLLARIQVEARGESALRTYYSAVYHTLQMPTLVSDVDGSYRGVDRRVHRAEGFRYYSDLSLWDTFRTEHPWLSLVYPEYQRDFVRSIMAMGDALGFYPRWPLATGETGGMVGDCGALMVADTALRGVTGFDEGHAWEIARRSSFAAPSRREGIDEYMALGYVPAEAHGSSASATLEYAYADGALAAWARARGAPEAERLAARAQAYRAAWDPQQRFLVGRRRDGSFVPLTGVTLWQDVYAEGNAWQYLWYAPHDLTGLADTLGGRGELLARLSELFARSMELPRTLLPDRYYWHGNEPDIHAPFLPSYFDDAATASRYVDWVRQTRYSDQPDGIPGNDDAGTMSAWYTLSALGVFPIAGTDLWLLAAPSVTSAEVSLPNGATLSVRAPDAGTGALNPSRITLDGKVLARPRLTHAQLAAGHRLEFRLTR